MLKHHHIGIACDDIKVLSAWIEALGGKQVSDLVYDPLQNAELVLFQLEDGTYVEAVCGKVIGNIIKKGITLYHTCYIVADLELWIQKLEEMGGIIVSEPKPAILFNNSRVCFVNTPMGLVELLEERDG